MAKAKRKTAARKRKSKAKRVKRKTSTRAVKRKASARASKRKGAARSARRKIGRKRVAAKRTRSARTPARKRPVRALRRGMAGLAAAADPVVQKLKDLIAADKIRFDADRHRKSLLGLAAGVNATRKLQALVLAIVELARVQVRISSVVRTGGGSHHVTGRAFDIGNEDIAKALLPRVATDAQVAALQIDELIFDARVAGQTDRNKWNYDRGVKHDYDAKTLNDHRNHIHFAVKA
jgi:hypothetical protein